MNFKTSSTYLVAMTAMVMLSACIKSESPKDFDNLNNNQKSALMGFEQAEEKASFYINGDANGVTVEEVTSFDGATKDVRAIKYRFEVCLNDKAKRRELIEFNFNISSPEGEKPSFSKNESTDFKGCLVWTETFDFDIGKNNPQPILFLRKIKAVSGSSRQGEVSFIFRLYPWAEEFSNQAFSSFYYLRDEVRAEYRGAIQRLYSGQYNPRTALMHGEGEKTRLYIKQVDYDLTAIPFSLIKKDAQPDLKELEIDLKPDQTMSDLPHLRTEPNFVMMPEGNNPRLNEFLRERELPLYRASDTEDFFSDNPPFDGIKINLTLKLKLAQPVSTVSGFAARNQTSGRFKVLPYIYSGDYDLNGDRVLLNPEMQEVTATMNDRGEMDVIFNGILPFTPTAGRVMIALQITPMDNSVSQYDVIEEIYTVGNFDQLIGKKTNLAEHPEQFDGTFNFVEYAKATSGYNEASRDSHLRKAEPYSYSLLGVRFNSIDPGETANRRTVNFQGTTCISDVNRTTSILEGRQYEVVARHFLNKDAEEEDEVADNEDREPSFKEGAYKDINLFGEIDGDKIKVDANGCITFMDQVRHKYYRTERLVRRKYFIQEKGNVQGFTKEIVIYMNPWDEKFGTLGTDARSVSQTFISQLQTRDKIEPRFYIQDFRYETLRFRYEIDKNMNLIVKKTVLFRVQPKVLRYSNVLQGINSIFPIRDGIYLLKIAYQKDYLDPAAPGINLRSELVKSSINPGSPNEIKPDQNLEDGYTNYTDQAHIERVGEPRRSEQQREKDNLYNRASGIPGQAHDSVINSGYDPNKKTSLSIVKKLVRVNSGAVVTPIEFSVEDLRLLRIRAQLFVQLETINQTRLQIVNMTSRLIDDAIGLEKATNTKFSDLGKDRQQEVIRLKINALDILAAKIPDDIYYTKEDASQLEAVFQDEEVITAFRPFLSGAELSSVSHMLQEVDPEENMMFSAIQGAFRKGEERQVREERLEKEAREIYSQTQALRAQTTVPADQSHYRPTVRTTDAGAEYFEKNYDNSDAFNQRCGEDEVGYDQCMSENADMDNKERERFCKCFDNVSKDYQNLDTPYGDALANLEERAAELEEQHEYLSAASIVESVREKTREFFTGVTGESSLAKLLLNDFTLAQADADLSDLNFLTDTVEDKVDIAKRTFVGPITFLNNTNGGALRPTDNLDEAYCVTDDCNSLATDPLDRYTAIQNYDYERSPYHGSIAHYYKAHVDDFIDGFTVKFDGEDKDLPSYKDFKENKKKTYEVKSLLSNFVDEYNLSYVSLAENPEPLKAYVCDDPTKVDFEKNLNGCLVDYNEKTVAQADLFETYRILSKDKNISKFSSTFSGQNYEHAVDETFLKRTVKKEDEGLQCTNKVIPASYATFDKSEYAKFCSLMAYGVFAKNYTEVTDSFIESVESGDVDYKMGGGPLASAGFNFFNGNVRGIENKEDPFFLDGDGYTPNIKPFVNQVYQSCLDFAAKGAFNEPLHVERKYRIKETGRYYYLGGKALNITLGQQVGVSHKNDSNKLHKMDIGFLTRLIPDVIKGYGYSYSRGEGISANESLNIQQGTFLVMQNAEFDVELKKYEQCLVFRWSEEFMRENKRVFFYNPMSDAVRDKDISKNGISYVDYITNKLTEGMMVCSGVPEETPIAVRETYYYFTQHFTEGDMQDRADIHNHPWLLSLRGVREFEAFLMSTLSDHEKADEMPETTNIHAEELVGMRKLLGSDMAAENLDGSSYEPFDKLRRNSWPLTRLINTYRKVSPTFPGLYTQLNRSEYEIKQWPWKGSVPGQKFTDDEAEECRVSNEEDAR